MKVKIYLSCFEDVLELCDGQRQYRRNTGAALVTSLTDFTLCLDRFRFVNPLDEC